MPGNSGGKTAGLTRRRRRRSRSLIRGRQPEQRATGVTLQDVLISPAEPQPGDFVLVTAVVTLPPDQDRIFVHITSPQFAEPILIYCVSLSGTGPHEVDPFICPVPSMCGSFDMPDGPVDIEVRVGPLVEGESCRNAPSWPHDDSVSLTVEPPPFSPDRVTLSSCVSPDRVSTGDTAEVNVTARNDNTQGAIVHVRPTANGEPLEEENIFIPANTETQATIPVDTTTLDAGTYEIAIEPISVNKP